MWNKALALPQEFLEPRLRIRRDVLRRLVLRLELHNVEEVCLTGLVKERAH